MSDSVSRNLSVVESNGEVKIDGGVTEVIVIRHGETKWNSDGRIQGHLDVELNDVGKQQAVAVGERLSREAKISIVYSSDLKRASETADTIARMCGGLEVVKDGALRERHLGDLQGKCYRETPTSCTKAHEAFVCGRRDREIPGGGESLDQLFQRSTSFLQQIAKQHRGERIVVVSHGGTIRELHRRASSSSNSPGKILNTSINVFHLSNDDDWTIQSWGDVTHLKHTQFLHSAFGGDKNSG